MPAGTAGPFSRGQSEVGESRRTPPFLAVDFSERLRIQTTTWRRRRDSNPRYRIYQYDGLANRWFQPLTHVSEARTPRESARAGQDGKRETREISGSSWHSLRHNTFPGRSAKQIGP